MHSILFIALFFFSGIAGLIYETMWANYLKLFLGHAAYAQMLVLAIYMGGMAAGAWIAGIRLNEKAHLLVRYAIVEIVLGGAALLFHDLFVACQHFSYDTVLPFLDKPVPVFIYKWLFSALIILPQSMLLGATFPYMAAGFIRRFPATGGYTIAVLYFANTLGASIGVLLSGFYLVEKAGFKGAIITAGCIDIFVGMSVLLICRALMPQRTGSETAGAAVVISERSVDTMPSPEAERYRSPLLVIAGATAASSFMYEVGWIRMLSLVLGSSTHSFELMLSTFIFGMALGSFIIRKKIDRIRSVPRALVLAQVIMGIGALLSIFTYSRMFYLMEFFMGSLRGNEKGYFLFNVAGDLICMLVMLPSTICAGMVLPLIIH
ncbi:MAG: hypothetical protein JXA18_13435, partial [Chitinispirillaceae bacterium]|nr:hypothetical protein [Chitinispirillaceae bacterium]